MTKAERIKAYNDLYPGFNITGIKKIDKVYSNNTTVLRKVGQFNNGEAIYESV